MKSLGGGEPVKQGAVSVKDALSYAMSLPVATTISVIHSLTILHQNLAIARDFHPLTDQETQKIRDRCAAPAADGHLELYKTSKEYDGAVGRKEHSFPSVEQMPRYIGRARLCGAARLPTPYQ